MPDICSGNFSTPPFQFPSMYAPYCKPLKRTSTFSTIANKPYRSQYRLFSQFNKDEKPRSKLIFQYIKQNEKNMSVQLDEQKMGSDQLVFIGAFREVFCKYLDGLNYLCWRGTEKSNVYFTYTVMSEEKILEKYQKFVCVCVSVCVCLSVPASKILKNIVCKRLSLSLCYIEQKWRKFGKN